jgi:hypothetical protein
MAHLRSQNFWMSSPLQPAAITFSWLTSARHTMQLCIGKVPQRSLTPPYVRREVRSAVLHVPQDWVNSAGLQPAPRNCCSC